MCIIRIDPIQETDRKPGGLRIVKDLVTFRIQKNFGDLRRLSLREGGTT